MRTFAKRDLHARYNAELANNIGNLVSRTLAMQDRYFKGVVQRQHSNAGNRSEVSRSFCTSCSRSCTTCDEPLLSRALETVFRATDQANKYITATAPFTLAKDQALLPRVGAILHNLLDALRIAAQLLTPFLPETCEKIFTLLALPPELKTAYDLPWGKAFVPGHQVQKPQPFPRLA
jgi:methionyl-tRNA synthetase